MVCPDETPEPSSFAWFKIQQAPLLIKGGTQKNIDIVMRTIAVFEKVEFVSTLFLFIFGEF